MVNFIHKECYDVQDLVQIVEILRSEDGCPWDREQTHESIRQNFIEETYEVCEAIDNGDVALLREELGDVLLQVVFHTRMEEERGSFNLRDVADEICKKLIVRHPHVFGDVTADTSAQVLVNWDEIKRKTKGHATHTDAMDSVARSLPALMRAEKLQSKARKAGFDWEDAAGAEAKVAEELQELKAADEAHRLEEAGDFLFAAVNLVRLYGVDSELALERASDKFLRRFGAMEKLAHAQGARLESLTLAEMDKLWEEIKRLEGVGETTENSENLEI